MLIENSDNHQNNQPWQNRQNSHGGIKFFAGSSLPTESGAIFQTYSNYRENVEDLREKHKVWRPEETFEAADLFFLHGKVNIVGSPQSGKGTILFGLSEICSELGWGYAFIDGHYQDTPALDSPELAARAEQKGVPKECRSVVNAIREAQIRNILIFFDSFDYLFAGTRKIRTISRAEQSVRTPAIMEALDATTVPVAVTHHDEEWSDRFIDKELQAQFEDQVLDYPRYRLWEGLRSPQSIRRFLMDHDISYEHAQFLGEMPYQKMLEGHFSRILEDSPELKLSERLAHLYPTELSFHAHAKLASFPVLKELVRGMREEFIPVLERVARFYPTFTYLRESPPDPFDLPDKDVIEFFRVVLAADEKCSKLVEIRASKRGR